jgi:DNA processing protein
VIVKNLETNKIKASTIFDDDYPDALKRIFDPPAIIFYKGDIKYPFIKSIAVVGTRKATSYGQKICEDFVVRFSELNFTIVSGMAAGIDIIAHKVALKNNAKCIGVIGHGFDYYYPVYNKKFYDEVLDSGGCLISECLPSEVPIPGNFPSRNRIIAGLSKSTFVVEAAIKSGSLITAKLAFAENRDVYAAPADITRQSQQGCNELIKLHIAKMATSVEDILSDYGVKEKVNNIEINSITENLDSELKKVVELISLEKLIADQISRSLGLPISNVGQMLTELELIGVIDKDEQMRWGLR